MYWWNREIFSRQKYWPWQIDLSVFLPWGEGSWKVELLFILVSRSLTVNTQQSLLGRWTGWRAAIHMLCSLLLRRSAHLMWFCQFIYRCLFNLCTYSVCVRVFFGLVLRCLTFKLERDEMHDQEFQVQSNIQLRKKDG